MNKQLSKNDGIKIKKVCDKYYREAWRLFRKGYGYNNNSRCTIQDVRNDLFIFLSKGYYFRNIEKLFNSKGFMYKALLKFRWELVKKYDNSKYKNYMNAKLNNFERINMYSLDCKVKGSSDDNLTYYDFIENHLQDSDNSIDNNYYKRCLSYVVNLLQNSKMADGKNMTKEEYTNALDKIQDFINNEITYEELKPILTRQLKPRMKTAFLKHNIKSIPELDDLIGMEV